MAKTDLWPDSPDLTGNSRTLPAADVVPWLIRKGAEGALSLTVGDEQWAVLLTPDAVEVVPLSASLAASILEAGKVGGHFPAVDVDTLLGKTPSGSAGAPAWGRLIEKAPEVAADLFLGRWIEEPGRYAFHSGADLARVREAGIGIVGRFPRGEFVKELERRRELHRRFSAGFAGRWAIHELTPQARARIGPSPADPELRKILPLLDGQHNLGEVLRETLPAEHCGIERLLDLKAQGALSPLSADRVREGIERALDRRDYPACIRFCEQAMSDEAIYPSIRRLLEDTLFHNRGLISSGLSFALRGRLRNFNLVALLEAVGAGHHEGMLRGFDEASEKIFYFRKGAISLLSMGARRSPRIGALLVEAGKVTSADVDRALLVQKKTGEKLGSILVDLDLMSDIEIANFIRDKVEEEVLDFFLWEAASFEFRRNYFPAELGDPTQRVTTLAIDTGEFFQRVFERREELSSLRENGLSMKTIFQLKEINLDSFFNVDEELALGREVALLLDGRRTVSDLARETRSNRFELVHTLSTLLREGMIRALPLPELLRHAEEAEKRGDLETAGRSLEAAEELLPADAGLKERLWEIRAALRRDLPSPAVSGTVGLFGGAALWANLIPRLPPGVLCVQEGGRRLDLFLGGKTVRFLAENDVDLPRVLREFSGMPQARFDFYPGAFPQDLASPAGRARALSLPREEFEKSLASPPG